MTRGCAVGIDPGERWVGVARAAQGSSLALPVGVLDRTAGDAETLESLKAMLGREPVTQLVVGVPLRPDGREDEQATRFRAFGESLASALGATCIAQDERFSTDESLPASPLAGGSSERKARSPGRKSNRRRRRERERTHGEAAARILQRWLDSQAGALARERADRDH